MYHEITIEIIKQKYKDLLVHMSPLFTGGNWHIIFVQNLITPGLI